MKKFRLMAFTLLASSVALSGCFLLPKKKDTSDTSSDSSSEPAPADENWSDTVLNEMKQYLDGEVIPYIKGTWTWGYDEDGYVYTGKSTDTTVATAQAAFGSDWTKDTYESNYYFCKIHTKGAIEITVKETTDTDDEGEEVGDPYTAIYCYFTEEFAAWTDDAKELFTEYLGENLPFPGGTWSDPFLYDYDLTEDWELIYIFASQTAHNFNYNTVKSKFSGYTFETYQGESGTYEIGTKKSSLGIINVQITEDTTFGIGYVLFWLEAESGDYTFEFNEGATKALVNEDVTLTLNRGEDVEVANVTYSVTPSTAATIKSQTNESVTFTIKEAGKITFKATQGTDYEATYELTAYSEYPKPTAVSFKQSSYSVVQGKTLDLSKEFNVTPQDAEYTTTYEVTGNSKVTVDNAGLLSVAADATTADATVKVTVAEGVSATTTIKVNEPAKGFVKVASNDDLTSGDYLIVCEEYDVAFNGGLEKLDDVGNVLSVTIKDNVIESSTELEGAIFTYDASAKTLKSKSGYYIDWKSSSKNGLTVSTTASSINGITISTEGNALIESTSGNLLKFNYSKDQNRFRFYKETAGSTAGVQLYKKA